MKKNLLLFALLFLITGAMQAQNAPTVVFNNPAVIDSTQTSAVCCATVTNQGSSSVTKRGFCWGLTPNPDTLVNRVWESINTGMSTY